mgnify:CR=1 FL=1
MKAPKKGSPFYRWLGTLLAIGLLIYLLIKQGWTEFLQALRNIPPIYFVAAVVAILMSRLMVCGRWYTLLRSSGVKISFADAARLVFAGLFASNFLPTTVGGDVIRLAGGVQLGLDGTRVTASLIMDRLVGMAGMATLLPVGLPLVWKGISLSSLIHGGWSAAGVLPLGGFIKKWWDKGVKFLHQLLDTFVFWMKHPMGLLGALLWTYAHELFLFTTNWILIRGSGESMALWKIAGLWVLSYFVTLLPISINGLGVQEVTITYLFSTFGGISMQTGLALAILIRLLYLLASLPGVIFLPSLMRPLKPQPSPEDEKATP